MPPDHKIGPLRRLSPPSGDERKDLPDGWTPVTIDGEPFEANFVKIAVNVVRKAGSDANELPALLRSWFGADAGAPGTRHAVALRQHEDQWQLSPVGRRPGALKLWRSYSREEIPPLFGLEISTAIWNVGFVRRPGHIFLLVTIDKAGHGEEFQHHDRFVSQTEFEWQSQNRTGQANADGVAIRGHQANGVPVHLFVRRQKKQPRGGSAAFLYCGDVRFLGWEGEKPVTVRWELP